MLRAPDACFGDLHALDALEAEEQFDEIGFWLKATPLIVRPLRFTFTRWSGSNTPELPPHYRAHAAGR